MKRKHLVTFAGAVAVVAVLAGASFALQAVALRPPPHGSFVALRAAEWLQRYRLVTSTITLRSRSAPIRSICVQQWFTRANGSRRLGAVVRFDDGFVLTAVPPHTLIATGGTAADRAAAPLVVLELAGCPRLLARTISGQASLRRVSGGGNIARVRIQGTRLTLALDRRSGQPTALTVTSARMSGSARVRFERLTPALLRRYGASLTG